MKRQRDSADNETSLPDQELVQAARGGDAEAFNELVRRHRDKALRWAHSIARDSHLAEDIVQEALVKSFLHLGTLVDIDRFLPWLQRIVRNQALHTARRGGSYRHELPFTGVVQQTQHLLRVNYGDVDAILRFLAQSASRRHDEYTDPFELAAEKETIETIRSFLYLLSRRERAIFEAHFFEQLSPREIAGLLQTTTANIYMSISRTRKKLSERVKPHLTTEKPFGNERSVSLMRAKILEKPRLLGTQCFAYNVSIRHCLHHLHPYIGREGWSYSKTMGYTAHAFHINLKKNAARVDGTFLYDGLSFTQNAMINLGMHNEYFDILSVEKLPGPRRSDLLDYAMEKFRRSIDKGVPFLCSKGRQPEFSLAYGYDDSKQCFYAMNTKEDGELPYRDLAEGHLYAFVCDGLFEMTPKGAMRRSLDIALRHSRGEDATFAGCVNGLAAYDCWIGIFVRRAADPLGNAASLSIIGSMRHHAAEFLRQSAATWEGQTEEDVAIRQLLEEAAKDYDLVAHSFAKLQAKYPFPSGGDPGDPVQANEAILLLQDAKTAEMSGLSKLQRIVEQLGEAPDMPAIIPNDPFFY